jgi:predicted Zn finger-like uncharacterized protein
LFTQCSKCETVFKLSAEVLRAAGGQVRCGKCGEIFNALAHLAEDPSVFASEETEIDLEFRADSILESPAPMTPRQPPPGSDDPAPGMEIARLQILDWNENESSEAPGVPLDPAAPPEQPADDVGETSMEFTLPPGELDRIFVETKQRKAPGGSGLGAGPGASAPGARPPRLPVEKIATTASRPVPPVAATVPPVAATLPPHPEDIEIFDAANREAPSPLEEPSVLEEPSALEATEASSAAAASGLEVSEDIRREMLSGMESPRTRARRSPFELTQESGRSSVAWSIAAALAALLLVAQVVNRNREWFAAHSPLGGSLLSPPANLSAYQLRQWGVTGDPAGDGTLRVRASILNTAAQLEPFPLLRVTLVNRFGGGIGTRDFEPSEYLGKPTARLLAPGERADATLDILDPGKSAEGFEIDVCLRSAERKISCANDAAPAQAKR